MAPAASRIIARAHLPRVDDAESSRDVHRAHDLAHSSGRARHHRAGLPRAFDAPRPVALASWRMGGGGAPADANDAPPPRRARRRDDHDDDDDDDDESAFSRAPQRRGSRGRAPAAATAPARTDAPNLADAAALPATFPDDDYAAAPSRTVWQERHDEKKRNRAAPTLAESLVGEALYGLNPARAALAAGRRDVHARGSKMLVGGGTTFDAPPSDPVLDVRRRRRRREPRTRTRTRVETRSEHARGRRHDGNPPA